MRRVDGWCGRAWAEGRRRLMIAEGTLGAPNGASRSQKHGNDKILITQGPTEGLSHRYMIKKQTNEQNQQAYQQVLSEPDWGQLKSSAISERSYTLHVCPLIMDMCQWWRHCCGRVCSKTINCFCHRWSELEIVLWCMIHIIGCAPTAILLPQTHVYSYWHTWRV